VLNRLPVRVRLALSSALVIALLLAVGGWILHFSVARGLDGEIGRTLDARLADVQHLIAQEGTPSDLGGRDGATIAQVVDETGATVAATGVDLASLLTSDELARAATRRVAVARRALPTGDDAAVRILAAPGGPGDRRYRVLVGERLHERDEALRNLKALLAIGGSIGLILASLAAYGLATAAFRPVEAMRRRAARISGNEPGARLPLGPADDELRSLGETLNEMLERIDGAMARERAFVANASHELRSPLAIIKGELELALRPGRSPDELRAAICSAAEETDRVVQLAEDLLVIARLDQGKLPVRPEPISAGALLEDVRTRFTGRIAQAGRELRVEPSRSVTLDVDRLRVEQAIGNLVENALRHGAGPIVLSAEPAGEMVELHVRDGGPGFPPEFAADAFERFSRADPGRGRGGAGLGLSIVDAIARAHGGTAGLRTGDGADVWIALPRFVAAPGVHPQA
jgi:signal transduction histidine kinase